jgi:hypothetical protein
VDAKTTVRFPAAPTDPLATQCNGEAQEFLAVAPPCEDRLLDGVDIDVRRPAPDSEFDDAGRLWGGRPSAWRTLMDETR